MAANGHISLTYLLIMSVCMFTFCAVVLANPDPSSTSSGSDDKVVDQDMDQASAELLSSRSSDDMPLEEIQIKQAKELITMLRNNTDQIREAMFQRGQQFIMPSDKGDWEEAFQRITIHLDNYKNQLAKINTNFWDPDDYDRGERTIRTLKEDVERYNRIEKTILELLQKRRLNIEKVETAVKELKLITEIPTPELETPKSDVTTPKAEALKLVDKLIDRASDFYGAMSYYIQFYLPQPEKQKWTPVIDAVREQKSMLQHELNTLAFFLKSAADDSDWVIKALSTLTQDFYTVGKEMKRIIELVNEDNVDLEKIKTSTLNIKLTTIPPRKQAINLLVKLNSLTHYLNIALHNYARKMDKGDIFNDISHHIDNFRYELQSIRDKLPFDQDSELMKQTIAGLTQDYDRISKIVNSIYDLLKEEPVDIETVKAKALDISLTAVA